MFIGRTTSLCAGVLISVLLGACGGGGGGGDSKGAGDPAPPTIHGVHVGALSNGLSHATFVLDNEEFYTMYGMRPPGGGDLATIGFLQGSGTLSNGSFSSADVREFTSFTTVQSGTLSASYTPGVSLNGTYSSSASTVTFTSVPLKLSVYDFSKPANPSAIAGAWSVKDIGSNTINLSIAADGSFTGSSTAGCSLSGTMKPRASGKNVFDVTMTLGLAPCAPASTSVSGSALEYRIGDGRQQIVIAGTDAGRTVGAVLLGTR